jgi:beta-glucosidase
LDGTPGFTVEFHEASDPEGPPLEVQTERTDRFVFRSVVAGRRLGDVVVRLRATLTPPVDGDYELAVNCAGQGTLRIDGQDVLALGAEHNLDWSYLFRPDSRALASAALQRGKPVAFEFDYRMTPGPAGEIGLVTLRARPPDPEGLLERAVAAASAADVAIVVAGLGEEHECEGYDRPSLDLPPEQKELIGAVAAANRHTVVVLSAGAPVLLDWAEDVPAVLLVWYAGEELASALGAVMVGQAEPGGRLPMSFSARPEDLPVLDPAPDDADTCTWRYREGLFIGYRHFDRSQLEPAYCFGQGLGYTCFGYEELQLARDAGGDVLVTVRIRNRGARCGKEVVQVYVGSDDADRPRRELKAFGRIDLDAGAAGELRFRLGERAFSHWDTEAGRFAPIPGPHEIAVGSSSRDLRLRERVTFVTERTAQLVPGEGAP